MNCFGCNNEGKPRDVGGTTYHMCDECYQMHVERNSQAVEFARQQIKHEAEVKQVIKEINGIPAANYPGPGDPPSRAAETNKEYAQHIITTQVNAALDEAVALENAGCQAGAHKALNMALEYEEALRRLYMLPAAMLSASPPLVIESRLNPGPAAPGSVAAPVPSAALAVFQSLTK